MAQKQMIALAFYAIGGLTARAAPTRLNITLLGRQSDTPSQDRLNGMDFPDPCFWVDSSSGAVTAMATQGNNAPATQFASAQQFGDPLWSLDQGNTLLTGPPSWAKGNFWAPSIGQLTDGDQSYYMYYTASVDDTHHCLGLARSADSISGDYTDGSSSSWICPTDQGGAIDPAGFLDPADNSRYIVYKIDAQAEASPGQCGPENNGTPLLLQQTQNDGYTLIGGTTTLQDNAGESDGYNIEAPSLCQAGDGTYFLFFSSNCYDTTNYAIAYVSSTTGVLGPYGNRQQLMGTGDYGLTSPGGADVAPDCSRMVFHAYVDANQIPGPRGLHAAYLSTDGTTVTVQ